MDQVQAWVAVIGSLAAALLGILKYFNYKSRRDRIAAIGSAFSSTVEGLSSAGKGQTQSSSGGWRDG